MCKTIAVLCVTAALAFAADKKYKDNAEFETYNAVTTALTGNDFRKALADLETWKQKYPATDFADDRQFLYVLAYVGAKEPGKALDAAGELIDKDLDTVLGNAANVIKLLFNGAVAIQQLPSPTPGQLEIAGKAARRLLAYDRKPEGVTDAAWVQPRAQLRTAANAALLYIALLPGTQAMQKNNCAAAETAFQKALGDYPDSAQAAWYLGSAQLCLYKTVPEKASPAIYEFARAAGLDPVKGMVDPKWQKDTVEPYLNKVYTSFHGADPEGLSQLKQAALNSPVPPAGFHIKSVTEISLEKEAEFEKSNPQLALWMKIKGALADANGEQYFAGTLKDSGVPQLKGVLVDAKPACRPKELLIAVPLPGNQQALQSEISLKLDKPLTGKPELKTEVLWEGVPTAFTASPFLLTMDTETAKIEGLKVAPCGAPPRKK